MGAARGCDSPLPLREVTWFARDRRSKRGSCTATNYLIYGCARLDGDSHVVENEILIARESVGSGAQGESTECKLDKLCRTGKGDPMTSRAQAVQPFTRSVNADTVRTQHFLEIRSRA